MPRRQGDAIGRNRAVEQKRARYCETNGAAPSAAGFPGSGTTSAAQVNRLHKRTVSGTARRPIIAGTAQSAVATAAGVGISVRSRSGAAISTYRISLGVGGYDAALIDERAGQHHHIEAGITCQIRQDAVGAKMERGQRQAL